MKSVRIIGGEHKRRLIRFHELPGLRPTPDRLRETVFNWLMPLLPGARVLDAFAGSGVLGFESLSRGAAHCTFYELHRKQVTQIKLTLNELRLLERAEVKKGRAEMLIATEHEDFDLVFVDPPYQANLWSEFLDQLPQKLASDGYVYIEADQDLSELMPDWLSEHRSMKQGQIYCGLYRRSQR